MEYPMRLSVAEKNAYSNGAGAAPCGPNSRVSGGDGNGRWTLETMATEAYIDDQTSTCTTRRLGGGNKWKFSHRNPSAWYEVNGPFANGSHLTGYGHNSGLGRIGKMQHNNTWCLATWGVDFRFVNYNAKRGGVRWQPEKVGFVGCPAVFDDGPDSMYEPHLDTPISATGGSHQGSDWGSLLQLRRNYTFADGHARFISMRNRPRWSHVFE
jgi:prepilin-type processing-associated H-X9-DG protein